MYMVVWEILVALLGRGSLMPIIKPLLSFPLKIFFGLYFASPFFFFLWAHIILSLLDFKMIL